MQYQAFLLYQFGEIQHKSPICVTPDSTISYMHDAAAAAAAPTTVAAMFSQVPAMPQ